MNTNIKDDFYTSINYNWLKNIKLNENKSKLTEFVILNDKNKKK